MEDFCEEVCYVKGWKRASYSVYEDPVYHQVLEYYLKGKENVLFFLKIFMRKKFIVWKGGKFKLFIMVIRYSFRISGFFSFLNILCEQFIIWRDGKFGAFYL